MNATKLDSFIKIELNDPAGTVRRIGKRYLDEFIVRQSKRLCMRDRTLIKMRHQHGYSFCEMACLLGVADSTINRRLKKIVRDLMTSEIVKT